MPEYWIVHPEGRLLERWRPGSEQPQIVDATLTWEPVPDTPPLVFDLDALFAEVLDDG